MPDARVGISRSNDGWTLTSDVGTSSAVAGDDDRARAEAVRRLCSEVHLAIAAHARDSVFVHAGSVAWRGAGIVVPGRSMAGKSTLVEALLEAGASYLSDEYAVLDADGNAHPYAKPLSMRRPGRTEQVAAADLPRVATAPVPVAVVVDTRFEAGATWAPTQHRGAETVLPLVDNAVAARISPESVLAHTAAVARRAVLFRGPRGEATDAAAAMLAVVDALVDQP